MDEQLKQYLDGMVASIMAAMGQMESRIMAALETRHLPLDALARKLEGDEEETTSSTARIQEGH